MRPLLAVLVAIALAAAPLAAEAAMPCHGLCDACDAPAAMHDGASGLPLPCKGMVPGCMNALTCLSTVALPGRQPPARPHLTELAVAYWTAAAFIHGRTVAPGLDPPIAN